MPNEINDGRSQGGFLIFLKIIIQISGLKIENGRVWSPHIDISWNGFLRENVVKMLDNKQGAVVLKNNILEWLSKFESVWIQIVCLKTDKTCPLIEEHFIWGPPRLRLIIRKPLPPTLSPGLRDAPSPLSIFNPIFLHAVYEGRPWDAEHFGRLGLIPLLYPESLEDIFLLHFI